MRNRRPDTIIIHRRRVPGIIFSSKLLIILYRPPCKREFDVKTIGKQIFVRLFSVRVCVFFFLYRPTRVNLRRLVRAIFAENRRVQVVRPCFSFPRHREDNRKSPSRVTYAWSVFACRFFVSFRTYSRRSAGAVTSVTDFVKRGGEGGREGADFAGTKKRYR